VHSAIKQTRIGFAPSPQKLNFYASAKCVKLTIIALLCNNSKSKREGVVNDEMRRQQIETERWIRGIANTFIISEKLTPNYSP